MQFDVAVAGHRLVHALTNSPKGLTEDTLYNEWAKPHGVSKSDYHSFVQSGIEAGALVRENGKVNMTETFRNEQAPIIELLASMDGLDDTDTD